MIVVCKKFRLIQQSKGKFKNNDFRELLRNSVKLEKSEIEAYNKVAETSGVLYVIDEEATQKRLDSLATKEEKPASSPDKDLKKIELEAARSRAKDLGIEFGGNTGLKKLNELIEAKLNESQE